MMTPERLHSQSQGWTDKGIELKAVSSVTLAQVFSLPHSCELEHTG